VASNPCENVSNRDTTVGSVTSHVGEAFDKGGAQGLHLQEHLQYIEKEEGQPGFFYTASHGLNAFETRVLWRQKPL